MIIKFVLRSTLLCLTICHVLTRQTEEKHFNEGENNKTDHKITKTTTHEALHRQRLRNFQKIKRKHSVSGKRRQYLTGSSEQALNQRVQSASMHPLQLLQGNTVGPGQNNVVSLPPNLDFIKQPLSENDLSRLMPFQQERILPKPFLKPDIRLVPKLLPLHYTKKPDVNVAHVHLEQGVNPCQNSGLVVQSSGGYSCLCRKGYKGKHCQEKELCFPNPCQNGGNCLDLTTHFQCACAKGFKGLRCEESDSCTNNPCKHGATCLDLKHGLHCVCALGYKGKLCTEIDFCNPNPCRNGGTCTQKNMVPVCLCTNDYKGSRCEAKKVCLPNPCKNSGVCKEERSSSPCDCTQGFTGKYCTDHVCTPNPCLNGGACSFQKSLVSRNWLPICKCLVTFKGDKCEIPNPCAAKPSPCKHGVCFDTFNARHMDVNGANFICTCHRGYMGPKCDIRKCDKCAKHAKCQNAECVCDDGYYGNGHVCTKLPDPCIPNPCKNLGKCVQIKSSYDCKCPLMFDGERCEFLV